MEHTKGPWDAKPCFLTSDAVGIFADNVYLAVVKNSDFTFDQNMANACLMAAAPELLESLQDVVEILEVMLRIDGEPRPGSIGYKARAAIAKAKGEVLNG